MSNIKKHSDNYLCECGHNKISHYISEHNDKLYPSFCGPCRFMGDSHRFKLDNLRFLEMKSEQKDAK